MVLRRNVLFFARRSGVSAMVLEVVGQETVGFFKYFMFLTTLFPSDAN